MSSHIADKGHSKKAQWIADLTNAGLSPEPIILAFTSEDSRFEEEYSWIYLGRASGWPLTNTVGMATDKYMDLVALKGNVLVVREETGLTWERVKHFGFRTWASYIGGDIGFYMVFIALFLLVIGMLISLLNLPNKPTPEMERWTVVIFGTSALLLLPICINLIREDFRGYSVKGTKR